MSAEVGVSTETPEVTPGVLAVVPRLPRVNLLPPQVIAARRLHRTQQVLAAGLAGVLLVVGGAWYVEHTHVVAATSALQVEQARAASLTAESSPYAEVPAVLAEVDSVRLARAKSMAGDVLWYQLMDAISRRAPAGCWITSLTVSPVQASGTASTTGTSGSTAATASTASTAVTASTGGDPLAKPAIATIQFSGYGLVPTDVASWLDGLTAVPGLSDARYSTSSSSTIGSRNVVQFNSTVGVTATALSHRFDEGTS